MEINMADFGANFKLFTSNMHMLAMQLNIDSGKIEYAATDVNKARRHMSWRCNQESLVTNEIDNIKGRSDKISQYLKKLANLLDQNADAFTSGQDKTLSGMTNADIRGL